MKRLVLALAGAALACLLYTPVHAQDDTGAEEPASSSTYTVSVALGDESAVLTVTVAADQLVAIEAPSGVEVSTAAVISPGLSYTHTWAPAEADYYTALVVAHRTLGGAVDEAIRSALAGTPDKDAVAAVVEARQAIFDLAPPPRLLSVDSLARFAGNYCRDITESAADALSDDVGLSLMFPTVYAWLDRCRFALRDVKVEAARFAALHGGYPSAVLDADATLVE